MIKVHYCNNLESLEDTLNDIGWERVLQVLSVEHHFVIIYER